MTAYWTRLRLWWQALAGSLWFVPALMIAGAIVLAVVMIRVSDFVDPEALLHYPRVFGASAESSRQMLATIAGAMMTVAGVTFSITVLAVTQASSQYTPRILRNFMRDRPNQVALGTLTGVFVYCLVVLRTVRGEEDLRFIPSIAVVGAFVLAIVAIGDLVYFIHHVASSLQASGILARVSGETIAAIDRLFPDEVGEEANMAGAAEREALAHATWRTVPARRTGYLAHVDAEGLIAFAADRDVVVRMERGIGEHVIAGTPLVAVTGGAVDEAGERAVTGLFTVATFRTVDQDAAFGIRQMVDMATKALSPGVNDTSTAIASIDSLGAVLVRLAARRVERRVRVRDGRLRVIARGPTFESLASTALDEIRQNAAGNVSVLARLLATLETVAACTADPGRRVAPSPRRCPGARPSSSTTPCSASTRAATAPAPT